MADRIPPKPQEEFNLIKRLVKGIETVLKLSDSQQAAFKDTSTDAELPVEEHTSHMDWYKPLL